MSMRARGAKREQDDASADADMDGGATKSDDNDDEEDRNPEEITQSFPQRVSQSRQGFRIVRPLLVLFMCRG